MANYIRLPNGAYYEAAEGQSASDAMRDAFRYFPQAFGMEAETPKAKKEGILGALGKGFESMGSSAQTAFEALTGSPEEAAAKAQQREAKISERHPDQVSLEKVKKVYEERGILPAAGEALSQIPAAIAEQAPNIGATLGGARAGAALGSLAGPVGTVVGGIAGAALPSLITQFGGNVERQAIEQEARGEPVSINRGTAALAAVPQAALDVAGNFIPFGGQLVSKLTGIPAKALTLGVGNATKLAEERLLTTLAKGTATGVLAEIPTEIAQQMLERAQAGLSLTDSSALKEYGETAYQVGLLGPLGAVGRISEKGVARQDIEAQRKADALKAAQEEEARNRLLLPPPAPEAQQPLALPAPGIPMPGPEATGTEAKPNVVNMMDDLKRMKEQEADLQQRLSQATDTATIHELAPAYEGLQVRIKNISNKIEQAGGIAQTPEEFDAQATAELKKHDAELAKTTKKLEDAKQLGEWTQLQPLATKVDELTKQREDILAKQQEKRDLFRKVATPIGETPALFSPEETPPVVAQTPQEALSFEQPKPEEAPKRNTNQRVLFSPKNIEATAERNTTVADQLAKTPVGETAPLFTEKQAPTIKEPAGPPKPQEVVKETKAEPVPDTSTLDLFTPENFTKTEERNLPDKEQSRLRKERLDARLLERLQLPGTEVKRTASPQQTEYVLNRVEELQKKINEVRGMQKTSRYDVANNLKTEYETLKARVDAGEKGQVPNSMKKALERYESYVAKHITPVQKEMESLHKSLYEVKQVAPPKVEKEAERAKADEASRRVRMSKEAKTQARINKGDVRKEAETSEKMRNLARELGREEPEYAQYVKEMQRKLKAAIEAGQNKTDVTNMVQKMLVERAEKLGKTTPEYKRTLKEQIEYFRESFASAGKQELKSQRTTQVTRDVRNAPKEMRTGSNESLAQKYAAEDAKAKRQYLKEYLQELKDAEGGTAYRTRATEGESIDPKEAQDFIDKVKADLPDNVNFVYAATPGKIPVKLLTQMSKEGIDPTEAMVQGAVFSDGTVLIVGDQHANLKDLEETVAHELVGHYGIDTLIGIKQLQEYANKTDLYKLATDLGGQDLLTEVQRVAATLNKMGRSEAQQKLQVLREIIAHTEEHRVNEAFLQKAGRWLKELVGMVRAGMRRMGFTEMPKMSTSDVFYALKESRKAFANKRIGTYRAADGQIALRTRKDSIDIGSSIVSKGPSFKDKFLGNILGLAGRVQFIDQYAALSAVYKKGLEAGVINDLEAEQAEFYMRFGQMRSEYAGQILSNGPLSLQKTAHGYIYKSTKGVNMIDVSEAFGKANVGNESQTEAMATLYLAAKRAEQVGWEKLNFENTAAVKADYARLQAVLKADPKAKDAFEEGAKLYQQYNAGLLDLLVQTGFLSKTKAAELKAIQYVPYYRVAANGEVQLMIDKETPIRLSNIKDEPQLIELVGDNKYIQPLFTSSIQNTFMITNMALRNQMVKDSADLLYKLGVASRIGEGEGPRDSNTVRYKLNGKDFFVLIDKEKYGIPADLIVKGMEGIKTTIPAVIRMLGLPADVLRKFVTRNPAYALRQVIRDPMTAWLTTGTDATPVLSSLKELSKMLAGRSEVERTLMESGAISSNVFTGDQRDMQKLLRDISAGKSGWAKAIVKLDAFAMQGDAATRAVVYKDSLDKGMSEMQALLRTLESMNFSRRGLSPSVQMLSTLIPFFNAQIQGLDVLYRAFKGQMPYNDQLKIKEKLWSRGMLLAMGTMAYAAMMQDDDGYKEAKPEERYGNWFVYIPGTKEPLRIPIPFELGILFKALPEAVFNLAYGDEKTSEVMKGFGRLLNQSNPLALPQAFKPLTEVVLGKSFYGGDIESSREQKSLLPTERYRASTTELAKLLGSVTGNVGLSPIKIDYLIRGYTGPLGIAITQLANPILNTEASADVAKPTENLSKMPFIGGLFQPVEGRGTLDQAYERMEEIQQAKGVYNRYIQEGKRAEAQAFAQEYAKELAASSTSGQVQKALGEIAKQRRMVISSARYSTEEKDAILEKLDARQKAIANRFLAITDRT